MKNKLGFEVPEHIEGFGHAEPFKGAWAKLNKGLMEERIVPPPVKAKKAHTSKLKSSLEEAVDACNPKDGMTVSFHHHLRGGDYIVFKTMSYLNKLGIKNITLASSSLTSAHDCLVPFIKDGTIGRIFSSGIRGELGKAISQGVLETPVVIHSHGGRARAIKTGRINIDLAIVAASSSDCEGNSTGSFGKSAFGSIGYSKIDVSYAKNVVVVTDNLVKYPCIPTSLRQHYIDYVVEVDTIGDPSKIATGTTRITKSPMDLRIAEVAAEVIQHSGVFKEGFSFQVGAGGASLAVAKFIRDKMTEQSVKGSFMIGGVTSYCVDMLEEGLFDALFDVQSFDAAVSESVYKNHNHIEISSDQYACPFNCGSMTNKLDVVVLGALEVDVDFNVNVITGADGVIRGASGGHSDTASGASLTVVVCPSYRGRLPMIKDRVQNVVTPGESVDVLVTERGICVNPLYKNLEDNLKKAGLKVIDIKDLKDEVESITGKPVEPKFTDKIVGVIEYRDGTIVDVIKGVEGL